jgi:hypothetical protein
MYAQASPQEAAGTNGGSPGGSPEEVVEGDFHEA